MKSVPTLYSLQVFDAVARRLSFTRAAEELGVSQGAVSFQIRQLEGDIGTKLFIRQGRGILLSRAGDFLFPQVRLSLEGLDKAVAQVSINAKQNLTISLTTYFASRWLLHRLSGFVQSMPKIELRLVHSSNTHDGDISDVAIRWGRGSWPGIKSELLFLSELAPVCAPDFGDSRRVPSDPQDLRHCTILLDDEMRVPWTEWFSVAGTVGSEILEGPVFLDPNVLVQAAMERQGFALADALVTPDVEAGRLVVPFDAVLRGYGYYLTYGSGELSPVAQSFREWILSESKNCLYARENWVERSKHSGQKTPSNRRK